MAEAVSTILMTEKQNESIASVVNDYGTRLGGFIRKRVDDLDEADDILQDVYLEFIQASRMDEPISQVASWLFRVARNKIIDRYRKKKTGSLEEHRWVHEEEETYFLSDLLAANERSPADKIDNALLMLAVEEALAELPKEQRDVFVMHELEEKSFAEISQITGVSLNTLLSRKRYALLHLRRRLENLYNELFD
jgi:RNA polymerase sigma factor (sigma-70 family)